MRAQEIHRVTKSQQISMSVIYMHFLNTICLPCCHYNGFVAAGALGDSHVCFAHGCAQVHQLP